MSHEASSLRTSQPDPSGSHQIAVNLPGMSHEASSLRTSQPDPSGSHQIAVNPSFPKDLVAKVVPGAVIISGVAIKHSSGPLSGICMISKQTYFIELSVGDDMTPQLMYYNESADRIPKGVLFLDNSLVDIAITPVTQKITVSNASRGGNGRLGPQEGETISIAGHEIRVKGKISVSFDSQTECFRWEAALKHAVAIFKDSLTAGLRVEGVFICYNSETIKLNRDVHSTGLVSEDLREFLCAFQKRMFPFVKELDLGDNSIGDAGAAAVAEALKVNNTVQKLDLVRHNFACARLCIRLLFGQGDNNIRDAGAAAVVEMLKFNSTLTEINLVPLCDAFDLHEKHALTLLLLQDRLKRFLNSKANNVGHELKQQIEALVKRNKDEPERARDEVAPFRSVASQCGFVPCVFANAAVFKLAWLSQIQLTVLQAMSACAFELSLSSAPSEHFECSGFFDAALMVHSISHALDNHSGSRIYRCSQFDIVHVSPRCFPAAAVAVKSIDISSNHLKPERLPDLLVKLRSFSVLERITVSDNPDLRVLSFEFMQFVSQLKHFNCTNCSLVVPPQRILTSPDRNPEVIGSFIISVHIDISELQLVPTLATAISSILQDVIVLRRLTMYGNPNLRDLGVTRILSCLSGCIKQLDLGHCGLSKPSDSMLEQLRRFSALEHVCISRNPSMGFDGVTAWVESLPGKPMACFAHCDMLMPLHAITPVGTIKYLDVSYCGLDILPAPIVLRLCHLESLHCATEGEPTHVQMQLPPLEICMGGINSIRNFFFNADQQQLQIIAETVRKLLDMSYVTYAPAIIAIIRASWYIENVSPTTQQLWVSVTSHMHSDSFVPLIDTFLDEHIDQVADVMKWSDYFGRSALATTSPLCKSAMLNRALFMGKYDIKDGMRHEYKSATCTVYLVDLLDDDKRIFVALKFMKNAHEFEREMKSRDKLLALAPGEEEDTSHRHVIRALDSYFHTNAAFQASMKKRRWLVDYDQPCLIVMPAADRNLRVIMDNERITQTFMIKLMFRQILNCVKCMHTRGIIHGDLKPRNVVRTGNSLSLIDLDCSAEIGEVVTWSKHSSAYIPPESLELYMSIQSDDVALFSVSGSDQCTISFVLTLPMDVAPNAEFSIVIPSLKFSAVHSLVIDSHADLSCCTRMAGSALAIASPISLIVGKHMFTIVVASSGYLSAAEVIRPYFQQVLKPLSVSQSNNKDTLSQCFARILSVGIADISHDIWSLGVILYRFCARESIFHEDDEDNIKDGSEHLLKLALWTDAFKQERLQRIDDTATRALLSKLLEKEPWKRPRCLEDVIQMPFSESDIIESKLKELAHHGPSNSSNLVGDVKDLRTAKLSDAAFGLRHYLKVADNWNEESACTLRGIEDEIKRLKNCPDCAQAQASVLQQLGRINDASSMRKLAAALSDLQIMQDQESVLTVEKIRFEIENAGGWCYGMKNVIAWPSDVVRVDCGGFFRSFCQPMCKRCQMYCLDYTSIAADLHYIMHEPAVEKLEWNGVRDFGRTGHVLKDFTSKHEAVAAKLTEAEVVALRLYTSHSFNAINLPMRDLEATYPHPLPSIVTCIQKGLKKLRVLRSDDASSKQTVVLWRAMRSMKLSNEFSVDGGTEVAPMSTTADIGVAMQYAVRQDSRSALLFRFVTRNNLERGADVQWLSMFPGESETLFPPLTFLQRTRPEPQVIEHDGFTVTVIEVSATLA